MIILPAQAKLDSIRATSKPHHSFLGDKPGEVKLVNIWPIRPAVQITSALALKLKDNNLLPPM